MINLSAVALTLALVPPASAAPDPLAQAAEQAAPIAAQVASAKHDQIASHLSRAIALRQKIRETLFAYGKRLDRQIVGEVHGSYSSYFSGSVFSGLFTGPDGEISGEAHGSVDGTFSQLTLQGGEFFSLLIQGDSAEKFMKDPALNGAGQDPTYPLQCADRIADARGEVAKVMTWSKATELGAVMKQFRSEVGWLEQATAGDAASANQRAAFESLRTWAAGTKVYPSGLFVSDYQVVKYHETDGAGKWTNQLSYVHFGQDDGQFLYLLDRGIALPTGHLAASGCEKNEEILDYISTVSGFKSMDELERMLRVY